MKTNNATKQLALQKLRDGLSTKEVADLTGVSTRTLERWKSALSPKSAMPSRNAPVNDTLHNTPTDDEKTTIDFEDSPAPVEKKSVVDSAMASLKGMLGIADKKADKTSQPVFSAKLDAKRQQFVDSATPTLSLAFMALASWMWGRIGPEYRQLAPSDEVAAKIVTPLLRVYARHASFMTDISPDAADIGASMFALVAYVNVTLDMYREIKYQKEEEENGESTQNPNGTSTGHWREYRRGYRGSPAENGTGNQSGGHAPILGGSGDNGAVNGGHDGTQSGVNSAPLTDKEAYQRAALSRLGQLDYQHRARRSMQP